jgi:hypothetical protein
MARSGTDLLFIKSKEMKLVGHAARTGDMRTAHEISVGNSEGKRQLRRQRDIIKMDLTK